MVFKTKPAQLRPVYIQIHLEDIMNQLQPGQVYELHDVYVGAKTNYPLALWFIDVQRSKNRNVYMIELFVKRKRDYIYRAYETFTRNYGIYDKHSYGMGTERENL